MDQYEDDELTRRRVLSNGQVLAFIAGYWRRRPWLFAATVALTVAAIGFELYLPRAAQAMVDAAAGGRGQIGAAWRGWRLFVFVYVAFSILRNLGMRFWTPLAAWTMQEMTNEGFRRVQSFSADWHGDTFAGATVRRLSRAMWGYDTVSDAALVFLGPAILVLIGLCAIMTVRWPMVGLFATVMVALYIGSNIVLTNRFARPLNLRS